MGTSNLIENTVLRMPKVSLSGKRLYSPADDEVTHFVRKCKTPRPTKGRKCIVPGSVVILLSGRFRGRRVVVLKNLDSGLLLVTGPYKLNGVPLKRVNPAYVLPTSSRLNVANVDVNSVDDAWFSKSKAVAGKKGEAEFFADNAELSAEEKERMNKKRNLQKDVDTKVLEVVKSQDAMFAGYLRTRFSLRNNMRFHEMSF